MSSTSIRSIRKKKSSLSEVKIAVLGAGGVGKTAIVVRFLTKRYIGEYDHQTENRYKSEIMVDGEPVIFEIIDSCSKDTTSEMPRDDVLQWADGFLIIYSITDRISFNLVKTLRQYINDNKQITPKESSNNNNNSGQNGSQLPIVVIANKSDLIHLRQVSMEEGEILSKDMEFIFTELSAAEHITQVSEAFHDLCREVHAIRRRTKQSLLDRVLGKNKV